MSGRFADPRRTATLALPGGCQCPGTPHERDEWVYRTELGASELQHIWFHSTVNGALDETLAQNGLLELASVSWNVLGADGETVPLTRASFALLDVDTLAIMAQAVTDVVTSPVVPNRSAARSRNGSRASGSLTPSATKGR